MTEQLQQDAPEAAEFRRQDEISQLGIDCAEFLIGRVKSSDNLSLNLETLKEVAASTLSSLTLYVEDADSPFVEDKEG